MRWPCRLLTCGEIESAMCVESGFLLKSPILAAFSCAFSCVVRTAGRLERKPDGAKELYGIARRDEGLGC